MDLSAFYNQFREETAENIRVLNSGLMEIERLANSDEQAARQQIDAIFRAVHTIKGSARLLGFGEVSRLAHAMESALGAVREGQRRIDRALADGLLYAGDRILDMSAAAVEGRAPGVDVDAAIARFSAPDAPPDPVPSVAPASPPLPVEQPAAPLSSAPAPLPEPPPPPAPLPGSPQRTAASRQTVRVRVDRLDRLINLTGELVVGEHVLETHRNTLEEFSRVIERQEVQLNALEELLSRLRFSPSERQRIAGYLDTMLNGLDHARNLVLQQNEQFNDYLNQHHLLLGDLEQEVMSVRLLPISTLFGTIPRAVRDLAATVQKEVELDMRGETTELDRKLLEALHDPLLHLIRNAIDHGIETPDERIALGKPRAGKLTIQAHASGGEIRISITDDGKGMNPARLRETAIRKRLISAESAALLNDREALELVFMPGLTTAALITDISGRGVGMDVVRTNISELGGQVQIDSQPGQGTCITLLLPLTLITTRILMVRVGATTFALPASGCRGTIWVYRDQIRSLEGQATIEHEGRTLPLMRLADLLNVEAPPAFSSSDRMPALLIGGGQRGIALLIDRLLDEREAVVKPLGTVMEQFCRSQPARMPYSGAVQPGDRSLVLLLNPAALTRAAVGRHLGGMAPSRIASTRRSHLLVADDSFTTRELMRSILQSAGYDVALAIDGSDALDKLRAHPYDLVISDVEMPRVDGFQLTSRIRQELGLDTLPVVIMTSLASEHHRRRGLEAGAQAYIVKSQFNQDSLLEVIQQLLGEEAATIPAG